MSQMNFSALSDEDLQISTKAHHRGFVTELDENKYHELSTHVENSDKGSRRNQYHHNEERIDEVEEEGSGRTSPPGTIGDPHEYMSENIKTHPVNKIKQKSRHLSVIGAKNRTIINQNNGSQERESESIEEPSQVAVVSQKVKLGNEQKQVNAFKLVYDQLFSEFQGRLVEEYKFMK